jgi:hypothetical protein
MLEELSYLLVPSGDVKTRGAAGVELGEGEETAGTL